jgi:signal transduction histidine kinase
LFTGQVWVDFAYAGRPLSWGLALVVALADWETWALLTPVVVLLAQRFRFSRASWRVPLAVHLPAGFVVGGAKLAIEAILTRAILGYGPAPFSFLKIHLTLLTYWAIVAVTHVARRYRDARDRELRSSQLETALAHAQVEALKMQLHPHFLFNTLNTIAGLMREDVEAADLMLAKLAELLRRTFETADVQEVPLERELEFLDAYLTIQRSRYGDRLRVSIDASEEARQSVVPSLILQPLVENAIRHGIAEKPGPGCVDLDARLDSDRLVIRVSNDGPDFPATIREGFVLRNIRSRLERLYGADASFSLQGRPGGGAIASLHFRASRHESPS